jgi:hypothetical protein
MRMTRRVQRPRQRCNDHGSERYVVEQPVPWIDQRCQPVDPGSIERTKDQDTRDLRDAVERYVTEARVWITHGDRENVVRKKECRRRPAVTVQHQPALVTRKPERDASRDEHKRREQDIAPPERQCLFFGNVVHRSGHVAMRQQRIIRAVSHYQSDCP